MVLLNEQWLGVCYVASQLALPEWTDASAGGCLERLSISRMGGLHLVWVQLAQADLELAA